MKLKHYLATVLPMFGRFFGVFSGISTLMLASLCYYTAKSFAYFALQWLSLEASLALTFLTVSCLFPFIPKFVDFLEKRGILRGE